MFETIDRIKRHWLITTLIVVDGIVRFAAVWYPSRYQVDMWSFRMIGRPLGQIVIAISAFTLLGIGVFVGARASRRWLFWIALALLPFIIGSQTASLLNGGPDSKEALTYTVPIWLVLTLFCALIALPIRIMRNRRAAREARWMAKEARWTAQDAGRRIERDANDDIWSPPPNSSLPADD